MKKKSIELIFPAINGIGYSQNGDRVLAFVSNIGKVSIISSHKKSKVPNIMLIRGFILLFVGVLQFFSFLSISLNNADTEQTSLEIEEKLSKNSMFLYLASLGLPTYRYYYMNI
jgi:hypothetical protein